MRISREHVLLVLFAWGGIAGGAFAQRGSEQEDPYPFGKAEFEADKIASDPRQGVPALLDRAGRYRNLCIEAYREKKEFREIEHFGREAKNWYRESLRHEPSNAFASLSIGYIDLILGRAMLNRNTKGNYFSAAVSRFREALEKRPGYADAYLYMAQVQALRSEYEEAEKNLRLILNSGIEDSQIHGWMAYVLAQLRRGLEAEKHAQRAIELDDPSGAAQWSRRNQQNVSRAK